MPSVLAGGKLHGVVKSGNVPLPGVTVNAQNTLTGRRYATVSDLTGAWAMTIPQDGRYVVRTQFAGFAQGAGEALLNAANRDHAVNFDLMLASRAAQQEGLQNAQNDQAAQAIRQMAANGPQALNLMSAIVGGAEAAGVSGGSTGAALPAIAGNSDFAGASVAVTGQAGWVSPMAGVDMDRLLDAFETARVLAGADQGSGGLFGGGPGGPMILMGGPGGLGGFGGGRGGRGNLRGFKPGQLHGSVFWTASNSALNAEPFSLRGQAQDQPASGTNRFGLTFMGAPLIPGVMKKPSGKDTLFLTLSGSRNSTPLDKYATVPTAAERAETIPGV